MAKPKLDYLTDSDKTVLADPDHFLVRVFQHGRGWVDSVPSTAKEAIDRYDNIMAMNRGYRMGLCAVKTLHGEQHLVPITPLRLVEYVRAAS